jgi:hypothetical protein
LTGSVFRALCTLESVIYVLYNTVSDHDCEIISVLDLLARTLRWHLVSILDVKMSLDRLRRKYAA